MLNLGPLVFATPWVLAALAVLPVIYWLLRVTPPAPRLLRFPAIRLLRDLVARERTPERTPLWLLLLRLLIAALVIVALARPLLNPAAEMPGSGPLLLVVDNGWAAAAGWAARQTRMLELIDQAERQGRRVVVLATTPDAPGRPPELAGPMRAAEARTVADALAPQPWPADRAAALAALDTLRLESSAHAVWLTDGLDGPQATALAERLQRFGSAAAVLPAADATALLLTPPDRTGADLTVRVQRVGGGEDRRLQVRATGPDGRLLARQAATFAPGATVAEARLDLPTPLRNEATRLAIEGETTAGAVVLLDQRWRRHPVGLVADDAQSEAQPLLSDTYYPARALAPFSEITRGSPAALTDAGVAAILLPDRGTPAPEDMAALEGWMERGGVLIRFAGPLLAANPDPLVPVPLRFGDRTLSGALSWTEPMPLAPFTPDSPFYGLEVPQDVLIDRQVLAEPTIDLAEHAWARLADGTPLVTAEAHGDGWLVLVHTTAGPEWSNLPLSGLFVAMLRRMVSLGAGVAGEGGGGPLPPLQTLDGFGRLEAPPATALPLTGERPLEAAVGPAHPPGFYGSEDARQALNLGATVDTVARLQGLPQGVVIGGYDVRGETPLQPWLLAAAMLLVAVDLAIALALRGLIVPPRRRRAATLGAATLGAATLRAATQGAATLGAATLGAATLGAATLGAAALAVLLVVPPAQAQTDDEFALMAANDVYLAYVETGIAEVDEVSRAGLDGLSRVLRLRTAAEPVGALGVDPAEDELAFFPLLYWPVVPEQPDLSGRAAARLNDYLRHGGMILFDTRDQAHGGGGAVLGAGPGGQRLRTLAAGLDIPPLSPVPPEHVLTRAFYLMQDFPGRFAGGELWVETADAHVNDGVSSVIIGGNDWAGAWAMDETGRPLFPVVPGGERQREMAYRFGVNLVMYALTGNYKADQVHVPSILERLGQ